ncbi:mitogen-activated protein kinase-binding protein 1-like [Paramacrobiotus metropolitanus]|uniref:mitogen-activated protein kinase-binding protein 1-like n=1 Tax=Paramacrobiotus metropolitanus TaxID=2943436 RepID=UPI0024464B03|nr:mitogen-activated protein kinase-binding protein 1-like [Paramacrobiotus metropolitanus]
MADRSVQSAVIKSVKTNSLNRRMTKLQSFSQRVQLDTVLGLTVTSNAGLAVHPTTGIIAYTAGCSVVLLDPVSDTQQHLIVPNKRTLSAVTFNKDGRYLASGECGQTPCLRIWDTKESTQICELTGHKNGITLAAFSPDSQFLISVGTHHDNLVIVWDWRNNRKAATNKVTWEVKGIAFSEDGSFFVTVGNRHVKYWYLELEKNARADIVPLIGRSAVLGEYKDECFLDVVCGKGICAEYTYAVTQSGHVCQFNSRRSLEKLMPLKNSAGTCLSAGETGIVVGCAAGMVRVFDPTMLTLTKMLPLPHHLGLDVTKFTKADQLSRRNTDGITYPECVAIAFDELHDRVIVIFNDHSLYVWDIHDPDRTSKLCSHLYHSRCVWGVDVYAPTHLRKSKPLLPLGSFLSCSSDDTIRMWNINATRLTTDSTPTNVFCTYTQKILYNDPTLQYICNKEINPGGVDPLDVHADSKYGIRCVRIDPYGEQIACGDRMGHIHIYELNSMKETYKIEAHDSEVLCLEYSKPDSGYELLASASRDRLIQVFDVKNDYDCLQTLDDHSSSITALRFATLNGARQFGLISCGVDKAVILRTVQYSPEGGPKLILNDQILSKGGIVYDMDIDPTSQSIITANQDRQLRVYSIKSRKLEKTIKGSASDEGALIKLDLHDSGRFIATSCSDKNLAIIDMVGGDCWAAFSGHSEIVTGLKFNKEESTLISVSGDGCIFVWKVAADQNVSSPKTPLSELDRSMPLSPMNSVTSFSELSINGSDAVDEELEDIFHNTPMENSLPGWAKNAEGKVLNSPSQDSSVPRVRGRWADEMDHIFLQDDLVGESADSEMHSSPKRVSPFGADRSLVSPLRSERSFASSSSESVKSMERLKKGQSMFIPFEQEPLPQSTNGVPGAKRSGRLSAPWAAHEDAGQRSAVKAQPSQPSIMGFLGEPRKAVRDELDDEEIPRRPIASPLIFKGPNDLVAGSPTVPESVRDDSGSNSTASISSPMNSRPHTPSEVANKFLNLNASGIDKILKSRLPHRQSGVGKHQLAGPLTPVIGDVVASPAPASVVTVALKPTPPISPSKKLIQNAKLSANRQKFKSTQNLSTPLQSSSIIEDDRNSQGTEPAQDIRRATSMTSLAGSDFKDRNGLDGYNSLLERAKARLAQTKPKTEDHSSPPLTVPQRSRLTSLDNSLDGSNSPDGAGHRESRDRRPVGGRLSLGTLRSRSSERKALSTPTTNTAKDEDTNSVSAIKQRLERRARESSTSRTSVTASEDNVGESPTAKAIALIKAGIGLTDKPLEINGNGLGVSFEQCRQQCSDLADVTNSIVESITSVLHGSPSDLKTAELISAYCDTLSETRIKFDNVAKLLKNWDVVRKDVAVSDYPEENSRATVLKLQGRVKKFVE